jgi:ascorbate-specific PTS system EIIC-type component UlaA
MTVSIPLLALMVVVAYVAYRHMGLKVWHAVVCLILGFLLASTGAAPEISSVLSGIVHQAQVWLSGGKG